ncbi:MAG: GreA/GreB family elongation factor [Bacteroidetes bacterium]|jgi:regulator of nucleoside diphosphate kinase|nr:GreA/GreB family elongation factor [Bacteroidota bacterium]
MRPVISKSVYKKLSDLLKKIRIPGVTQLKDELNKATIVNDSELDKNIVSLNSTVEFTHESLEKPIRLKIVLPEEADLSKRKISIFAPISIALIGFKESYSFEWLMPSGTKQLKIIRVTND